MAKKKNTLAYDFIRNKEEQHLLEKYALLFSMEYFLLFKGNYLAISHLYAAMNLYDNEKLIRLLHDRGRGRSYLAGVLDLDPAALREGSWGDIYGHRPWEHGIGAGAGGRKSTRTGSSGGREEQLSFATQIYEDILRLAADEIVDKHEENLLSLARFFIEGAVDEESDPDRVFLQYYTLFLNLRDPDASEGSYTFARSFYQELFDSWSGQGTESPGFGSAAPGPGAGASTAVSRTEERSTVRKDRSLSDTFARYLRKGMAGTDFEAGHFLEKTTEDMLIQIARFLHVSGPIRVYSEIRRFHPARLSGTAVGGYLDRQAGLFGDVLASYHISREVFADSAPEWTDRKIHAALEDILASCYLNAILLQQRQEPAAGRRGRPGLQYFPPAVQVLTELYSLLLEDASLGALSALQEDYYRNFSFDKVTHLTTVKEMEQELQALRKEAGQLRERETLHLDRIRLLEELLKGKDQDLARQLREEMASYDERLEKLAKEKEELRTRAESLEAYVQFLDGEEDSEVDGTGAGKTVARERGSDPDFLEEMLPVLMARRFLFLGGGPDVVARMRRQFPSAVFVYNETQQANLSRIDYLIMFPRHMSHALFYKYIELARSEGIPVIYCNNRNYDKVLETICTEVRKLDSLDNPEA